MKVLSILTASLTILFLFGLVASFINAEAKIWGKPRNPFIDANGDGINDNALDTDGDGIPNGKDPDYTGAKARKGNNSKGFVDANGDGINDNALDDDGDGIPNGKDSDYVKPNDGTGKKLGNLIAHRFRMNFIDEDGDGINDLSADFDGDGIPNCQDPDYKPIGRSNMRKNRNADEESAKLAPSSRDRLRDGSCGTSDSVGQKKARRIGK